MTTALLRAAWHAGGMIAAAVERGWLARCSSAENGYPHLFGSVVSMHIATTYQPQFTARDVLVVVTREKDFTAGESANFVEAVVQKVSIYAPNYPVKTVLRTQLHAERDLQAVDTNPVLHKGFLNTIDHVYVQAAEDQADETLICVIGHRIQRELLGTMNDGLPLYQWTLPQRTCVLLLLLLLLTEDSTTLLDSTVA